MRGEAGGGGWVRGGAIKCKGQFAAGFLVGGGGRRERGGSRLTEVS